MIRLLFFLLASAAQADTIVAARTIRPTEIIGASDLTMRDAVIPGGVDDPRLLIGQEARIALYAGRPVRLSDVGPPAVIDRNQIVPLIYSRGGIEISTEGRALGRGGVGDKLRVMNMSSRTTVIATVMEDGTARVF